MAEAWTWSSNLEVCVRLMQIYLIDAVDVRMCAKI